MTGEQDDHIVDRIARFRVRRKRARGRGGQSFWRQVAQVGTMGWLIALPIVAAAIAGHALDEHLGTGIRWALTFIGLGLVLGGYSAWRSLQREAEEQSALQEQQRREEQEERP